MFCRRIFLVSGLCLYIAFVQVQAIIFCENKDSKRFGTNCYEFRSSTSKSWQAAQDYCETLGNGFNLASIHSAAESSFIFDEISKLNPYSDYWIGLHKLPDSPGDLEDRYVWSDGTPMDYDNWAPGEPNDHNGQENCVEVFYTGGLQSMWNDHSCDHYVTALVCKAPAVDGWQEYNGFEYYVSPGEGDNSRDWYQSRDWCLEKGGDLASITTQDESDTIMAWAGQMNFKGSLWNGMNKLSGMKTTWGWSDGSLSSGLNNWHVGYPRDDNVGALCGYQEADDLAGKWRNTHCNSVTHGYICKRKKGNNKPVTTDNPVTAGGYCPRGYTEVGEKCFRAHVRDSHTGHTWEESMDWCRRSTAGYLPDLASINNAEEQAYITSLLQDASYGFWIGLYRIGEGNLDWRWADNSRNEYKNWAPLEPGSYTDKCAEVRYFPGPVGGWATLDCDTKRGFICQVVKNPAVTIPTPAPTSAHDCGTDFTPYWDACYKFDATPVTWEEASSRCSGQGGRLASVHSGAENAFIQTMAISNEISTWIGFKDSNGDGEYGWTDSTVVTYTNWGEGEPKRNEGGGCVKLDVGDGTWEDAVCQSTAGFICKKNDKGEYTTPKHLEGSCPSKTDWVDHGLYCYYFQPIAYETWRTALEQCVKKSPIATLASIHSQSENEFIYKQIMDLDGNPNNVWIGMYKKLSTGGFGWTDLSVVQYENWAPGEPNGQNKEQCVELYTHYFPTKWNDNDCDQYRGYVCKVPKIPHPPTIAPVPGTCPGPEWKGLGRQCYLFRPDLHVGWMDARRACSMEGGEGSELVSISDLAENIFVEAEMFASSHMQTHENYWLGMAKKKAGSPYHWVDGNTADYVNWEPGQPSNKHGNDENCVQMYFDNGRWSDVDCDQYRGYACKAPKVLLEQDSGLSSGDVAGIVIGVLFGVIVIAIIVVTILTQRQVINNPATRVRNMASGFSNPFYGSSTGTSTKAEDKEGIDNPHYDEVTP